MTNDGLTLGETPAGTDPFPLFASWLEEATAAEINDPNAMALATVDESGLPDVRMVLLKGLDHRGFVFYTNFGSAKGREILASGKAALNFHWKSLRRQVRVRGRSEVVSDAEADAYYATRPRTSRLGAWASEQSRPLDGRQTLLDRVAEIDARHPGETIPRPSHWSGFRIVPDQIEFWQDGEFRLHDRILFTREGDGWGRGRLYP
ncbi:MULTISPECIES: pyridoxamine 5'-phosphate oxidase [unclassified Aureimonas]|uniref:pyridoxamine 5'-phosphate oxidase n=1 Tax=unclassified Aureimonas TaxID=2615206 RepID=UPI0006F6FC4A|nr:MULTISPECIES: pyridoxamine 5'-phosphate oxidase [unclassified Aureimonas]KQT65141.1 pyridoxamine 5'-phosphate oxidase [Aureimonas sp. Leaf427]KQT76332.1 pyridoxamine 5'-phosphate oxidase [Aureimonas sp. Leaf460]